MAPKSRLDIKDNDLHSALAKLLKSILHQADVAAVLVPLRLPMKNQVMPTLIADPARLDAADPLAPAFPLNGAKLLSRLTRKPTGEKIVAVMRPCEIRAYVELVKLKQGDPDEVILIGLDCLGAYSNTDYARCAGQSGEAVGRTFSRNVLEGRGTAMDGADLAPACRVCEHPIPEGADVVIDLYGMDADHLVLEARSAKGEGLLLGLDLPSTETPAGRVKAVEALLAERTTNLDRMLAETAETVSSLEKLSSYLAGCVNCYNCRVACPVCYCKECVFVTDVFEHEPFQYLRWANRKGALKMPTDTVFYHLTRLAHMSTACVGCGQCSNACPNDVPVMELFRSVAGRTQPAFDYEAGRSLDEAPPLSVFREDEFKEVTGGRD
ncbi:MAG: Coenzyme F420 hydrogenase/dehydrogenase, beta subunit C-terminal domain [Proteobacteria bacterium]|nr:Coenzyme F420 hydrogenase/dehydrogenase, beta subunit C-terminal domain [Pseudomonadota bacterium]